MAEYTVRPATPLISVIVPVHQGAKYLPRCLAAIAAIDIARECWELLVVDDASSDGSGDIAGRYADTVIRLRGRPRGPAYARNRGLELARGDIIVFVDADVCIHADVLRRFAARLAEDPTLGSVLGTYDITVAAQGVVTAYRNLRHVYLRRLGAGDVDDFWPACGAVRRQVLVEVGVFDEWHYWRPQAEGAELGRRIRGAGYRILLDPSIEATHLKEWTLAASLKTDLMNHGLPRMRLLFQGGELTRMRAPSVSTHEKANAVFTGVALLALLLHQVWPVPALRALAIASAVGLLMGNAAFLTFVARQRGAACAAACIPLQLAHYLIAGCAVISGWFTHQVFGEPTRDVADDAFSEMGLRTWPPVPRRLPTDAWQYPQGQLEPVTEHPRSSVQP